MHVTQTSHGISRLSANTREILFEGIWPIPNGVSMNSYIIKGDKVAIIDGVCGWDGVPETLFEQLDRIQVKLEDIQYVVINHMEPDHSGWLEAFRAIRGDDFQIYTSPKAVPLLAAFFGITTNIHPVKDGDSLDLGQGHILHFIEIPNVHWPETIATFDENGGVLMPCDAFGSFGAIDEAPYDDQLDQHAIDFYEMEAVRYYANIVSTVSSAVGKAIDKVGTLLGDKVKIIAPGHGIVWRKDPSKIISDYKRYVQYQKGPCKEEITVIWGSMYGNTEAAIAPLVAALHDEGIRVHLHQIPQTHIGDLLTSVWTSTAIVLAMPTYEYKMFPPMFAVVDELFKKKVQNRLAFRIGSYGWSGGAQKELDELIERHKPGWQFIEPVEFKGKPTEADIALILARARDLANKVKAAVRGVT